MEELTWPKARPPVPKIITVGEAATPIRPRTVPNQLSLVLTAVAKVPVPPDVLAGRERLATVWEFEIEVSISPPIPLVAVEFDEALGHLDLRVPLDRRIWKRVRLVAIE